MNKQPSKSVHVSINGVLLGWAVTLASLISFV